jgi:O-antigen ligase
LNRITEYFPFLTFLIIPFLGGNHLSLYYVTIDKFWIETSFVLLLSASICTSFFKNKEIRANFVAFALFFSPYLLVSIASLCYTWNKFNTLNELNTMAWIMGCVYLFSHSEKKDSLLMALVLGASLSVVCMIIQYKVLLPSLAEAFKGGRYGLVIREKVVPFSSFLNEATLGGYFLFIVPLAIYFGIFQKKFFYLLLSSVLIFGLLLTLSRIGILLLSFLIMASAIIIYTRKGFKGVLVLGLTVFIASSIFLAVVYAGSKRHDTSLQETALHKVRKIPEHFATLTYRTVTWKKSISAILEKPLLGYGAGAFEYAYRKYYDASLYTRYAHNALIKVLVELGLLGLVCFLFYLSGFIAGAKKLIKETKYLFIFLSVVTGFLFSLSNVTFEIPAYVGTFFILSSIFFFRDQKIKRGATLVFVSLVTVLLGSFFFTAKADISQKLYEDGVTYEENGLISQAFASYKEAAESMPLNNNGHIGMVSILVKSGLVAQNVQGREGIMDAIVKYLPGIEGNSDKDSEVFFLLGSAYSLLGKEGKAERYFEEAMNYHPSSGYYMYETANFYLLHGKTEKASTLIKRMETYADRHTGSDMHGLYVYKMRDLQSAIEYTSGNTENALKLARRNLQDAENEKGITENIHAREYVTKEAFTRYFRSKVDFYESKTKRSK